MSGNPSVHRGKPGWRRALIVHTIATQPMNSPRDPRLTRRVFVHPSPLACSHTRNHRLSQSAGLEALKLKNSSQPLVPASAKGRLTAIQVPAAAQARWIPRSGSRPRNRPTTNGITRSAG